MTRYHAVMLDETRCEFGAGVEADTRDEAYKKLREMYPESHCVQLESPEDTRAREDRIQDDIRRGIDYDEDGRPFYTGEGDVDDEDFVESDDPYGYHYGED